MYSTHVGITWSLFVYHNLWLSLVRYIHNSFVLRLLSLPNIQFSIFHVILDPLNQFVVYLNNKPSSLPSFLQPSPHSVSPSHSPYDLVKHYVDHPASLVHRFSTGGASCQAPVIITLQNCSHCSVQVRHK